MLTPHIIQQELLALGFTAAAGCHHLAEGQVEARVLDGPRLLLSGPQAGSRYVAVLSRHHLAQEVASFQGLPLAA